MLYDPVYRHRLLEFGADACCSRCAFAGRFGLRFLDAARYPRRYERMLLGSIAFVAIGKAIVFKLLGMHQKWWRYFRLRDFGRCAAPLAVATADPDRASSSSPSRSTIRACRARS